MTTSTEVTQAASVCIESDDYRRTRAALAQDPIIRKMAAEVALAEPRPQPLSQLMLTALREYNRRGGTIGTHIGGPIEAIGIVLAQIDAGEVSLEVLSTPVDRT